MHNQQDQTCDSAARDPKHIQIKKSLNVLGKTLKSLELLVESFLGNSGSDKGNIENVKIPSSGLLEFLDKAPDEINSYSLRIEEVITKLKNLA